MNRPDPFEAVAGDLARLERQILATLPRRQGEITAMRQLFEAGGKRLRPALVLLSAGFGDYDFDRVAPAAIAVEVVHASTLVHDDVIDHSATRRGRPTVAAVHGEAAAIVVGDYFFAHAYGLAAEAGADVVAVLARAVMAICRGELEQQRTRHVYRLPPRSYALRIEGKTASLLAAACEIGGIVSEASASVRDALIAYGHDLGVAFQIVDDLLDYVGAEAEIGKPVGHDLLEGHSTLPLMLAYQEPATAAELDGLLEPGRPVQEAAVRRVLEVVLASGAIEKARRQALRAAARARGRLKGLAGGRSRSGLEALADYVVERTV